MHTTPMRVSNNFMSDILPSRPELRKLDNILSFSCALLSSFTVTNQLGRRMGRHCQGQFFYPVCGSGEIGGFYANVKA